MGRDGAAPRGAPPAGRFKPRAPMGRDAHDRFVIKCAFGFNPRAPMGRDW